MRRLVCPQQSGVQQKIQKPTSVTTTGPISRTPESISLPSSRLQRLVIPVPLHCQFEQWQQLRGYLGIALCSMSVH